MRKKTKIVVVISCIVFIYCIYLFAKLLANPTDTVIIEQGKIYKEETKEGYIIRDEQVIEDSESGREDCSIKS